MAVDSSITIDQKGFLSSIFAAVVQLTEAKQLVLTFESHVIKELFAFTIGSTANCQYSFKASFKWPVVEMELDQGTVMCSYS